MKQIVILILVAAFSMSVFSQSDFRSGYYITNTNDTVPGLIDYRGDIANSKSCVYKKEKTSEPVEFKPGTIKAYRFTDNKYYVTKVLPNDSAKRLVFMEYLLYGKASVFYWKTFDHERYYIEKDGQIAEMNNDEITIKAKDPNSVFGEEYQFDYTKTTDQYKGILRYYFQDAPELIKSIDNLSFTKKSLIKISEKYHEKVCNGEKCINYTKKSIRPEIHFGAFFETGLQRINMTYPTDFEFNETSKPIFAGGLLIQSSIPLLNERIFAQLSCSYGQTKISTRDNKKEYYAKNSNITGNLNLIYKFRYKKFVPNVFAGFYYSKLYSFDYHFKWFSDANPVPYQVPSNMIGDKSRGFKAGLGFEVPIIKHLYYSFSIQYVGGTTDLIIMPVSSNHGIMFSTGILL